MPLAVVLVAFITVDFAVTFIAAVRFAITLVAARAFGVAFIASPVVPDVVFAAAEGVLPAVAGGPAVLIAWVKSRPTAFHESATLLRLTGVRRWAAR